MSKSRSRKFAEFIRFVNFNEDGTPDIQGTAQTDELNTSVTTLQAEKDALAASLATLQAEKDALATQLTTVETTLTNTINNEVATVSTTVTNSLTPRLDTAEADIDALELSVANIDPTPSDGSLRAQKLDLTADSDALGSFDGMTIEVSTTGEFRLIEPPKLREDYVLFTGSNNQYTWTVPDRVTSIGVLCIGGGGGDNSYVGGQNGVGGSCGVSTISVTPGTTYYITVGAGGPGGGDSGNRGGYPSYFRDGSHSGTILVGGRGGYGHGNSGQGDVRTAGIGSSVGDYTYNTGGSNFDMAGINNGIAEWEKLAQSTINISNIDWGSDSARSGGSGTWTTPNPPNNDKPGVGGADNGNSGMSGVVAILY